MIYETFATFIYESFKDFYKLRLNVVKKKCNISNLPLHLKDVLKESSIYVPDKIRVVLLNLQEYFEICWEIESTRITIYVLITFKLPSIKKLVKYVSLFVLMLNKLNKRDSIDILLANTGFKKRFPIRYKSLGPFHVNSGVTFRDSFCFVYREEEMYKVLLHELLHLYKIDDMMTNIVFEKQLATDFRIQSDGISLNECYNDALACLFIIALHVLQSNANISFKNFSKAYRKSFKQNYKLIVQVSSNILRYYQRKLHDNKLLEEKSHVFSYYICKAAILQDLDVFLSLLSPNMQLSQEQQKKYEWLLYKSLNSNHFRTLLETCDIKSNSLKMLETII